MRQGRSVCAFAVVHALVICAPVLADAATISVPAGGSLHTALNAARAGDTILLEPGATYSGNFVLPAHGGDGYITIRSAAPDALLPPTGVRVSPAYAAYLPKIVSPNNVAALRTAAGAAYWRLLFLEIGPAAHPSGTALDLGDGSSNQNTLALVPHHLIVDRVYVHGDAVNGQRRGIGLNSAHTTVVNSHISDIKLVGVDSQAIAGWNGPGPFHIENNYLEGAGEVVMFGGDDPRIDGMTPSDIVVRGNTVTRPLSWRDPILPAPAGTRVSLAGTGSLAAGTYAYRVVARRIVTGAGTIRSAAAGQATVVAGPGTAARIQWDAVPGATEYLVYGRTAAGQDRYWRTTTTEFVDDGSSAGTEGTPPSTGTVWQVKNLFELKHARRAQIDHNVMENHWAQAQAGPAILFTPRNQYGRCGWCVVEDVVFEYNIVRRMGGGIQLLGWDDERSSAQMNTIVIRHNEFSELSKDWGGNAYFLYVIDGPLDVTVDHNTVISSNGSGVIVADKRPAMGFRFTNNVMRHNTYGIFGSNSSAGLATMAQYFPDGQFQRNVLAGGSASKYPAGNEFPTTAVFQTHFVAYTAGDYALVASSSWRNAGTDGEDLGANTAELRGLADPLDAEPLSISTVTLSPATEGQPYEAALQARGGFPAYSWQIVAGALPSGVLIDGNTGEIYGSANDPGDFTISVKVTDAWGTTASQPMMLHVEQAVADVAIVTDSLGLAVATVPYAMALEASGGRGSYEWTVTGGALPSGLTLGATGVLSGTPAQAGTMQVVITATDTASTARFSSRMFALAVSAPPNRPPSVSIAAPAQNAVVLVGAPTTLAATVADLDGVVARVDYFVNGNPAGSGSAPGFTLSWTPPSSGTYTIHATAVDDRGASTTSASVSVTTKSEIVLHAAEASTLAGSFTLKADATAAGGYGLWHKNVNAAKVNTAAAEPTSYAEYTFYAEAGRPYQLWLRGRAEWNDPANDSFHVQFDNVASARIGTTASRVVNLEDAALAGIASWGWQDTGYGPGVLGTPIVFERTGLQTLRLQPREDGFIVDQIVVSPLQFLHASPGALKNDTTIVAR